MAGHGYGHSGATLRNQVAIITGAGQGLGRAYALFLASKGVKIVVNDYGGTLEGERGDISLARSVVDEIVQSGGEAVADCHDVSIEEEAREIVNTAVQTYGTVHILINNAGIAGSMTSHKQVSVASFRRTWECAALGTILLTSAVWDNMEKQGYGRIVNISCVTIYGYGAGGDGAYASTNAAVFGLTRDLGKFSSQQGIKINCVCPLAQSRMSDLSPMVRRLSPIYFEPSKVAPFVAVLASSGCPTSGEVFEVSAGRAARTTFATFPGYCSDTMEGYIENFDRVMGESGDIYIPQDTLDGISQGIKHATGVDIGAIVQEHRIE